MPASRPIKIHNVMTNIVGRTKTERHVTEEGWNQEIVPVLNELLQQSQIKRHKALIGQWVVEYIGNDEHMHEFFTKNWKVAKADAKPHVQSYVVTGIQDVAKMMQLLGLKNETDCEAHLNSFLNAVQDKKFKGSLRDPKLRDIETYPKAEQIKIALFAPATIYCSQTLSFVSLNTNYYGQLKSKSSLGPLEEYLIRKANFRAGARIENPEEVWLSMHAGCLEYVTEENKRRGIVIIAPTGTGKSTHGYGLVEAKKQNRLHSDDWVFVNVGSREVLISENQFYMRTNIAGIYPHLIPILVDQPLENVAFTPDIVKLLETFESSEDLRKGFLDGRVTAAQYEKIMEQMVENNAARSLIDPRLMVGEKFIEKSKLTDFFLMKRDYDAPMVLKTLRPEEMIEILVSKGNVFNYVYGKNDPDGYGIPQPRTTEIYYNPYLCRCEVDADRKEFGRLDQIRIAAYKQLAEHPEVKAVWINTRLSANQMQFCLRRYLEGGVDQIEIMKSKSADSEMLQKLHLKAKDKPQVEGRRPMDLVGFFDAEDQEVEVVVFINQGKQIETFAFYKSKPKGKNWLAAYSEGTLEQFFKRYAPLGVEAFLR